MSAAYFIQRPPELARDDTPMLDVVKHALAEIQGPDDQVVLIVQPTQPLRQPKHLRAAIDLLESSGADSVVSVVRVPCFYHSDVQMWFGWPDKGRLVGPYDECECGGEDDSEGIGWLFPARRQDLSPRYVRDGTCYAFRRRTITEHGDIYGRHARALIIPASESCALDTPEDWAEAERRLRG